MKKTISILLLTINMVTFANKIGHRPWGYYEVIQDTSTYKLKKLVINPKCRISLQRHQKREEHWIIVSGVGLVTLNDDKISVEPGSMVHVKLTDIHRIENTGEEDLVFIEVQRGTYFGEDDIERLEDDYGR
jgi:mannose-6-phosphate isomerase-like protein (cupin superfamily)